MWWRILVALVLTVPPAAYVAAALATDVEHREPHPTVVLPAGQASGDAAGKRGDDGKERRQRDRDDGNDDGEERVTVVRPDPVTVGDDGGDDGQDDDDGDDDGDDGDDGDDSGDSGDD